MILPVNSVIKRKDAADGGLVGGYFRFEAGSQVYGISCNHVIADINQCNVGDILTDANNNPIGTLSHWIVLDSTILNRAEFALFKPLDNVQPVWSGLDNSYKPRGFGAAVLNTVAGFTCGTFVRQGIITDISHRINITWNGLDYLFDCIEITARPGEQFSIPGHSGGAVFVANDLLGIILAVSSDTTKTYVVPYINGILSFVNLQSL